MSSDEELSADDGEGAGGAALDPVDVVATRGACAPALRARAPLPLPLLRAGACVWHACAGAAAAAAAGCTAALAAHAAQAQQLT
jgi:hypothetical protein